MGIVVYRDILVSRDSVMGILWYVVYGDIPNNQNISSYMSSEDFDFITHGIVFRIMDVGDDFSFCAL